MCDTCGCKGAEEGKVRTMSGKPHTPRKLRKDQNIKPEEARMRKKMEAEYYEPFSDEFYELTEADEEFWGTWGSIEGLWENPDTVNNWVEMTKKDESGGLVRFLIQVLAKERRKIKILERRYRDENIRTFLRRNKLLSKNVMNPETDGDLWGSKDYFKTPEGGWGVAWLNEAILAIDMEKEHIYDSQMNMYGDMGDGYWDYLGSLDPIRRKFVEDRDKLKNMGAETFDAESPFSSDAFNEGRSAGITMFVPEGDGEDYYSNLDTEYMIFYGLSPEDLTKDIDGNSKRYLQFVAGWDDGWNYATLLHEGVLTDDSDNEGDLEDLDYEMAGEWIYQDYPQSMREYVPGAKEVVAEVAVIGGVLALGLGYFAFKNKIGFKGETFRATESCSEDEDCPDGKVCVDGKCLPICVDDGDCASWRECRDDLHPTEKVCGEDKTDSNDNPFDFIKKEENQVDEPTKTSATKGDAYSTTTKAIIGVGVVGAIGVGLKALGGMKDKGDE